MNKLRTWIILLFALRLLLPSQLIVELLKLPSLVSHYRYHCQYEEEVHIFRFLVEHYGKQQHDHENTKERQAHHQLPFGSSHHSDGLKSPVQPFLVNSNLKFPAIRCLILNANPPVWPVERWHSQFSSFIWQPPKIG